MPEGNADESVSVLIDNKNGIGVSKFEQDSPSDPRLAKPLLDGVVKQLSVGTPSRAERVTVGGKLGYAYEFSPRGLPGTREPLDLLLQRAATSTSSTASFSPRQRAEVLGGVRPGACERWRSLGRASEAPFGVSCHTRVNPTRAAPARPYSPACGVSVASRQSSGPGWCSSCALALGALAAVVPSVDGRSFGGFLTHRIVCAIKGGCDDGDAPARARVREEEAGRVRDLRARHRLRAGRALDPGGLPRMPKARVLGGARRPPSSTPTGPKRAARHGVHPRGAPRRAHLHPVLALLPGLELRVAGSDHMWNSTPLRYARGATRAITPTTGRATKSVSTATARPGSAPPPTTTTRAASAAGARTAGRLAPAGPAYHAEATPATSPSTATERERTSTADALRLVPLEKLPGRSRYRPLDKGIKPPWKKEVWSKPSSNGT